MILYKNLTIISDFDPRKHICQEYSSDWRLQLAQIQRTNLVKVFCLNTFSISDISVAAETLAKFLSPSVLGSNTSVAFFDPNYQKKK